MWGFALWNYGGVADRQTIVGSGRGCFSEDNVWFENSVGILLIHCYRIEQCRTEKCMYSQQCFPRDERQLLCFAVHTDLLMRTTKLI